MRRRRIRRKKMKRKRRRGSCVKEIKLWYFLGDVT